VDAYLRRLISVLSRLKAGDVNTEGEGRLCRVRDCGLLGFPRIGRSKNNNYFSFTMTPSSPPAYQNSNYIKHQQMAWNPSLTSRMVIHTIQNAEVSIPGGGGAGRGLLCPT